MGRDEVSTFIAPNNILYKLEAPLLFELRFKLKRFLHIVTFVSVLLIV